MQPCESCGGAMRDADRWCSLCLAPRAVRPDVPVTRDDRHAPAPSVPTGPYAGRPEPAYSRWQGGVLSFGPRGRIVATVLVLLPPVLLYRSAGLFALAFGIMWYLFAVPVVLRDVWKRERVPPR